MGCCFIELFGAGVRALDTENYSVGTGVLVAPFNGLPFLVGPVPND